jgi:hypothetical protein
MEFALTQKKEFALDPRAQGDLKTLRKARVVRPYKVLAD